MKKSLFTILASAICICLQAQSLKILPLAGIDRSLYMRKDSGTKGYRQTYLSAGFMLTRSLTPRVHLAAGWRALVHTRQPEEIPEKSYHQLLLGVLRWVGKEQKNARFYIKTGLQAGLGLNIQTLAQNEPGYTYNTVILGDNYKLHVNYRRIHRAAITLPLAVHLQTMRRKKPFVAALITLNRAIGKGYLITTHYQNLSTSRAYNYTRYARGHLYGITLTYPLAIK
jgi:hypothetical protein